MMPRNAHCSCGALRVETMGEPAMVLACLVRKKLRLTLGSDKVGDERVYRIVSDDAQQPRKTKSTRRAACAQAPPSA